MSKELPKRSTAKKQDAPSDKLIESLGESFEAAVGAATPADARAAWERKRAADRAASELFDLAPPQLAPDFERIIEVVFDSKNLAIAHETLIGELTLGELRSDRGSLVKALDLAQDRAREAHNLYCCASEARKAWELDAEVVSAGMRTAAHDALQAEKDQGQRNKAITDADVTAKMAAMFPDEHKRLVIKGERVKRMVDSMDNLASRWAARASNLEVLLGKSR